MTYYSENLPYDVCPNLVNRASTLPNRQDWVSYIAPEVAIALLPLSDEAREHFTALLTNHEDPLAEIFDTGTPHARTGLNAVCTPERVGMQSALYEELFGSLSASPDHSDCLRVLDLDFLSLSDEVFEKANRFCRSLHTLGMRHFFHNNTLAMRSIACKRGLRELFLSECDISLMLSLAIAEMHAESLELLSFSRVKFMRCACKDGFCKSVSPGLREFIYVGNHFRGARARWRSIARHCKSLEVLRFEHFDSEVDWFRAFNEMEETTCGTEPNSSDWDGLSEMRYRTLDSKLLTPTSADESQQFYELTNDVQRIAKHALGNVYIYRGQLVLVT